MSLSIDAIQDPKEHRALYKFYVSINDIARFMLLNAELVHSIPNSRIYFINGHSSYDMFLTEEELLVYKISMRDLEVKRKYIE